MCFVWSVIRGTLFVGGSLGKPCLRIKRVTRRTTCTASKPLRLTVAALMASLVVCILAALPGADGAENLSMKMFVWFYGIIGNTVHWRRLAFNEENVGKGDIGVEQYCWYCSCGDVW
jgi:hypothetical protein